jgi:hypothetical protein
VCRDGGNGASAGRTGLKDDIRIVDVSEVEEEVITEFRDEGLDQSVVINDESSD